MSDQVARAYSATGAAWQRGPDLVYGRLAGELVARSPVPLAGRVVLDLGAGTGAASRALSAAGARPLALDHALGMLVVDRAARPPAVVGDALKLPLRDRSLGGVVAAFSINHLDDPVAALRECGRVVVKGGPIIASAYAEDDAHPVKAAVDTAAAELGWQPEGWYRQLKESAIPRLATVERAVAACEEAGLRATATSVRVGFPDLAPDDLVAWRLGMAQLAPFVATLASSQSEALTARAVDLMGPQPEPLVRSMIVITAVA